MLKNQPSAVNPRECKDNTYWKNTKNWNFGDNPRSTLPCTQDTVSQASALTLMAVDFDSGHSDSGFRDSGVASIGTVAEFTHALLSGTLWNSAEERF